MNINRLFKIVTVLFICSALVALVFGGIVLFQELGSDEKKEDKNVTLNEKNPDAVSPIGGDEELLGSKDSETKTGADSKDTAASEEKKNTAEKKTDPDDGTDKAHKNTDDSGSLSAASETGAPDRTGAASTVGQEGNPTVTADGLPIGQSVPVGNLKFDGSETHFVLQNINYQVNVRKEASKSSDKVGELLKGSYGVVLEKGPEFTLVECGDLTGYILNSYLLIGRAADEQIQGVSTKKVKIIKAAYIRDDAGMDSNKLAIAAEGSVYSLDPTQPEVHGWVAVVYNDAPKAYVSAAFCTVE